MAALLLVIIGLAASFVASKLMNARLSLLETLAVGVLGALLGGFALIWLYRRYLERRLDVRVAGAP